MKLSKRSSLGDVAMAVGDALRREGIRAVLSGGACASLYAGTAYTSVDADFVLIRSCTQAELDRVLAGVGFKRLRDRYVHPGLRYFLEFPPGPLAIGEDSRIRPIWWSRRGKRALTLSATDSCRDRLAAFYHWNDRQSLVAAVAIATRNRVAYSKIKAWSNREGHHKGYATFIEEIHRRRMRRPLGS